MVVEQLGASLKNPFENQDNDTPMTALCRTIEIDLRQQLGETDTPPPIQPVGGVLLSLRSILERGPHDVERGLEPGPHLERDRALVKQHAETVDRRQSGGFCALQDRRFKRLIHHVDHRGILWKGVDREPFGKLGRMRVRA